MRFRGSVLIVVLGLLAIMAVVGVTFVTMSSIDRAAAENFAANTQMILAADGAVDYVAAFLVNDVWYWDINSNRYFLLRGGTIGAPLALDCPLPSDTDTTNMSDAYLSSPVISTTGALLRMSFKRSSSPTVYGISSFETACADEFKPPLMPNNPNLGADNLGFSSVATSQVPRTGIWIPELSFPFDQYLVRISLTVLDHQGLLNLNAHGNTTVTGWPQSVFRGRGYFISDVSPVFTGSPLQGYVDNGRFFNNTTADIPGRWGASGGLPSILETGETCTENPTLGTSTNYPFALDDELRLRIVRPTITTSRIDTFGFAPSPYIAQRLAYTTVGWTAEVAGDGKAASHVSYSVNGATPQYDPTKTQWSAPKADLNRDSAQAIYNAMTNNRCVNPTAPGPARLAQLAANVVSFRDRTCDFAPIPIAGAPAASYVGADRQPIFSSYRVTAALDSNSIPTYTVKVEVYNPWPGTAADNTAALDTSKMKLYFGTRAVDMPATMGPQTCFSPPDQDFTGTGTTTDVKTAMGGTLLLKVNNGLEVVLDEIDITELTAAGLMPNKVPPAPVTQSRPIRTDLTNDNRGTCIIPMLYLKDWAADTTKAWGTIANWTTGLTYIPIRFPNSVDTATLTGILPDAPAAAGASFKALPRVGDLNQVLSPDFTATTDTPFWPWTNRVARSADTAAAEAKVKFNWKPVVTAWDGGKYDLSRAANVVCVGGPWNDGKDNDGDAFTDSPYSDVPNFPASPDSGKKAVSGTAAAGRFGGPELRVQGRINLNTATLTTLQGMAAGLGIPSTALISGSNPLWNSLKPLHTPAQIFLGTTPIPILNKVGTESWGRIEDRDWWFTRLSNVATVRSDTFSVYGTIEMVEIYKSSTSQVALRGVRMRRFWALLDRSPSLAFPPNDPNFIHPRVMNFQWID